MIAVLVAATAALTPLHCIPPKEIVWRDRTQSVELEGKTYHRLRSGDLKRAIAGKSISWPPSPLGEDPGSEWFLKNGTYGEVGHRGVQLLGRYRISGDLVWIRLPEYPPLKRMYFRASDGALAVGVFNEGCMNIGKFIAEQIDQ